MNALACFLGTVSSGLFNMLMRRVSPAIFICFFIAH